MCRQMESNYLNKNNKSFSTHTCQAPVEQSATRQMGTGLSGTEGPVKTERFQEEVTGRDFLSHCSSRAHRASPGPHLVCSDRGGETPPTGTRPGESRHRWPAPGSVLLCNSSYTPWEHPHVSLLSPAPSSVCCNYTGSHFHREP